MLNLDQELVLSAIVLDHTPTKTRTSEEIG